MSQDHRLIQQALQELRIDTPYYTAAVEPGASGVVFYLYGGRVLRWQVPTAAQPPPARRRRLSRSERQT